MATDELIPHLFRTEFRKIAAVLCKALGMEHLEVAEDITSETFLLALETWPYKGVPEHPAAWLYKVARNKALNYLNRNSLFRDKVSLQLKQSTEAAPEPVIDLSEKNMEDSQLQMLFALCHPSLPAEAQIGLSLRILCGFGIDEIAAAFLTNRETINKRLFRAREKLRTSPFVIEVPDTALGQRLPIVLKTLYLLFSEGYYSECKDEVLREDLCLEAMRLTHMLLGYAPAQLPEVNALMALMCFHASRFRARKNEAGELVLYHDQDESLWNRELIGRGVYYLSAASGGTIFSKYHLEASIAYWHTVKEDSMQKWEAILQLYNHLLVLEYSPVAALNRTYALSKVKGAEQAIREAEKLQLNGNPFYHSLLGELYSGVDKEKAVQHFREALGLARALADRQTIHKRLKALGDIN